MNISKSITILFKNFFVKLNLLLVTISSIPKQVVTPRLSKECGEVQNGAIKNIGELHDTIWSYFAEFMWRKMIGDGDVFEEVMRAWGKYWALD